MPVATLLIALSLAAPPPDEQVQRQAEAAYRQGLEAHGRSLEARKHFARAAALFEELRRRGARSAALDLDRGQAYLLAGDLPRAILAYHHGLRLAPNDATLRDRLEDARKQVDYDAAGAFGRPPVENWPPGVPRPTTRGLLILVLVCFGVGCVALTRRAMTGGGGALAVAATALVLAAVLGAGLVVQVVESGRGRNHPLVVIAAGKVVLHKGNGANYPCYDAAARTWQEAEGGMPAECTPLHRGVEARLRFDRGDWLQVELSGGEVGWVRRRDVVVETFD